MLAGVVMRLARLLLEPVWQGVVWLRASWLKVASRWRHSAVATPPPRTDPPGAGVAPRTQEENPSRSDQLQALWYHRHRVPTLELSHRGHPGWSAWSAASRSTSASASARPRRL
eukprot:scaffold25062_cov61-Phaeocystis_antarctica.AAC.4